MSNYGIDLRHRCCIVLAAVAFGVVTSAVNHGLGPASAYTSKVLGNDWAWLAAIAVAVTRGSRWRVSMSAGMHFIVPAVIAYYITDLSAGTYTSPSSLSPEGHLTTPGTDTTGAVFDTVAYLVMGTAAAVALSLLVVLIRRGGLIGFVAIEALPLYIAYTAFGRATSVIPFDAVEERTFYGVGIASLAAAAIGGLLYVGRWLPHSLAGPRGTSNYVPEQV